MSIKKIRQKAAESYKSIGLPSVKDESWRFTDISRISQNDFNHLWKNSELNFNPISEFIIVIENGKISLPKSNIDKLPKGIKILSILDDDLAPIDKLTNKQSGLVLLNTINFSGGVYIHVDKDIQFDPIIHIVYLSDSLNSGNHIRNLIIAEKGSRVTILEEYIGANECLYLTNVVTEIYVHDMAKVDHYKFQSEGNQSFHFQTIESQIGKNAHFNNHVITTGSILGRNDIRGKMLGQNSEAVCNGVYLLSNNQLFDTHLFMDHAVPACNSHELYCSICENDKSIKRYYYDEDDVFVYD